MPPTVVAPAAFLATRNANHTNATVFWLLTGKKGSGKTSWCRELVAVARRAGQSVCGLLSEPVFVAGRKVAIDLVDIASRERRRLAWLRARPCAGLLAAVAERAVECAMQRDGLRPGAPLPAAGRWEFDPETIAWGNEILRRDEPADLLIIDELGPLEFRQGDGLQAAFTTLSAGHDRLGIVVVRPSLVPLARGRWPDSQILTVEPSR